MFYQPRLIEEKISSILKRGKSIILFGARQTGKTTLLRQHCNPDLYYNFASPKVRLQFERNPDSLSEEIKALVKKPQKPLVIIDEVQKVPAITDVVQYIIDEEQAQFILTGSSARRLKKSHDQQINLLPGRVVVLHLDSLALSELPKPEPNLENLLIYGSLPGIFLEKSLIAKEEDLLSYVDTYLEEEIRQEAAVRNLGVFSKFLELAAIEAGQPINISNISQEIGISLYLISEYFQILIDCLIMEKIMPITKTSSRRRLMKAPKYLFFDLGVKRICSKEGPKLSQKSLGNLFEQFIGMEVIKYIRLFSPHSRLHYWRDHNGPEVDYVIDTNHHFLPIEIKWSDNPTIDDARHILKFMEEYPCKDKAFIVCRIERRRMLHDKVMAIPWQELPVMLKEYFI